MTPFPSSKHLTVSGLWGYEYVRHLAAGFGEDHWVTELGEEEDEEAEEESERPKDEVKDERGRKAGTQARTYRREKTKFPPVDTLEDRRNLALDPPP